MIRATVLTGFLGSGKTTLLARLLQSPALSRTAVIINEFGAVGLDHDLIATSDESFVELKTGCLCCTVRSDLVATVHDLLARRAAGTVPPFERIVIETSGLADPAPVLHALMGDEAVSARVCVAGVVTTVDAATGLATLARQSEAVKQAAIADRLVLTKCDIAEPSAALLDRLASLNPAAPMLRSIAGDVDPNRLLDSALYDVAARAPDVRRWLGEDTADDERHHHHASDAEVVSHVIVRDTPIAAVALTLFLEALAEHCGADLLRLKGIVGIAESPDRPAVIHGVQHVFHPPAWLERWPADDRRTRLVFISRRIPGLWFDRLLAAIEAEVADATQADSAVSSR
jgi:G3E family GTPase